MPIQNNRFYNNPALGSAFQNIAGMFAPPSGSDALGYVSAGAKKAEAERLAYLFSNPNDPNFDRLNIAAGNYTPIQSFFAQNQNNATAVRGQDVDARTTMRGQDVTATTSRVNNAADNQRALISFLFSPVAENAVRPALPASIADMFALPELPAERGVVNVAPGEIATMPGGETFAGAPKPLTESETIAQIIAGLPEPEQRAKALHDVPVEQIVTPEGPRFAFRADAINQEPVINKGAEAKPTNGMAVVNGQEVAVTQRSDGKWQEAQTGREIPPGIPVYSTPQPTGTNDELGIGKRAKGDIEQQLIDIQVAKNTAVRLRDTIANSPASQGMVGWLRGTAQNVIQTGGEVGAYFGGTAAEINERISQGLEDASLAGSFDTNIPAIEMMANLLAFQYAKTTTGERLSNEMLRASRAALGLDSLTSNQADATARLNTAISLIEDQENILRDVRSNGLGAGGTSPAGPPRVTTPEEFSALPSGTEFIAPDGTRRRKP